MPPDTFNELKIYQNALSARVPSRIPRSSTIKCRPFCSKKWKRRVCLPNNSIVQILTRNSSVDEIANVNFLYDDIVHVLQNTIDSCINSATNGRNVLERMFTKFSDITQCNGHYADQGHLRSPIFASNRKVIYDFLLVINTNYTSYRAYYIPFPSYG